MANRTSLYFIAILPDDKISRELTSFKQDFADRFESKRALRIMPHITLKIPFRFPVDEHNELISWFEHLPLSQPAFNVQIHGFGSFKKKKIIYAKPEVNPNLVNLQKELIGLLKLKYPHTVHCDDENFSPHMTIAYRDLSPYLFNSAWKEYENKQYHATFPVNEISLLEHNGSWSVIAKKALT